MVAIVSSISIVLLTFVLGSVFRRQTKEDHLSSCLSMFVTMTKSTLIGILVGVWISDIVFATVIAILISFLLVSIMTHQLSLKIVLESLGSLFMGAMMGAMLSIMATDNQLLSIVFFTILYLLSSIVAAGLWNRETYPNFIKGIPSKVKISFAVIIIFLGVTTYFDFMAVSTNGEETEQHHHQH
ncbi:hypothetical protein M3649_17740 [Ureibacillus chungkukjangi]|nr:hypothetical protein [Ureibacillus chungkukjangi]